MTMAQVSPATGHKDSDCCGGSQIKQCQCAGKEWMLIGFLRTITRATIERISARVSQGTEEEEEEDAGGILRQSAVCCLYRNVIVLRHKHTARALELNPCPIFWSSGNMSTGMRQGRTDEETATIIRWCGWWMRKAALELWKVTNLQVDTFQRRSCAAIDRQSR